MIVCPCVSEFVWHWFAFRVSLEWSEKQCGPNLTVVRKRYELTLIPILETQIELERDMI